MEPHSDPQWNDEAPPEQPEIRESFLHRPPKGEAFVPSLIYATCAAVVSLLCWNSPEFKEELVGNPDKIFNHFEWYRLVTSLLVHSDIRHLLANMLFLVPFGGLLTFYFGWRLFPLAGVLCGIVTQYFSLQTYPLHTRLIGSSGLLFALFGLWLSLYFKAESHLPARQRLLRIMGFSLIMLIPTQFSPQVSYRTHFIGWLIGLVVGLVYGWVFHDEIETRNLAHRRKGVTLH